MSADARKLNFGEHLQLLSARTTSLDMHSIFDANAPAVEVNSCLSTTSEFINPDAKKFISTWNAIAIFDKKTPQSVYKFLEKGRNYWTFSAAHSRCQNGQQKTMKTWAPL
jgi:hypothetical protein